MEDNFNKHLGNKLKLRRLALGLTQTKVAKAINVTFQQIQKYEKGTNGVSSARLVQISQFLKVPITYFYEGFIYGTEITRGLDVFRLIPSEYLSESEITAASNAYPVEGTRVFNPQQQIPMAWPENSSE